MDNIKLRLNLYVPGAQMLSSQRCEEQPIDSHDVTNIVVEEKTGKKKGKKETITVLTRKSRLVRQNINLTNEAYDYMIGKEPPYFMSPKQWNSLSKREKLKKHLDLIAENFNAVKYNYDVLDD